MTARVVREQLDGWVDPELLFAEVMRSPYAGVTAHGRIPNDAVWLDAGPHAASGFSYVALSISFVLTQSYPGGELSLRDSCGVVSKTGESLDTVITDKLARLVVPDGTASDRFMLGFVGWMSYDWGAKSCGIPVSSDDDNGLCMAFVTSVVEFDHERGIMTFVCTRDELGADSDAALTPRDYLAARLSHARTLKLESVRETSTVAATLSWRHSDTTYGSMIRDCQARIQAGDAYQLCLTNMATVSAALSPEDTFAAYRRLRRENPSHHGAFLSLLETTLLSSSPEVFLRVDSTGRMTSKPIKGTRARGRNSQQDMALRHELRDSAKEQAENVMIVDLMRNDFSRVAMAGSVAVDELLSIETYANVHQLVSTVSAQLAPECSAFEAVQACFPAGSMTGAPKISAMSILNDCEQGSRGIYSGAFGFLSASGTVELAMVIRSLVVTDNTVMIGSGGGITIDSDVTAEVAEMHLKVAPLLRALGVAEAPVI